MSPRFSVFILSHNKRGYVQEAVASVMDQDFTDFELFIIENSTDSSTRNSLWNHLTCPLVPRRGPDKRIEWIEDEVPDEVRHHKYVPSWLLNKYYPQASGDIILYLSDDDLFVPGIFRAIDEAFAENPEWAALYFSLTRANAPSPGTTGPAFAEIPATGPRSVGEVDCCIDGGQVAYRKHVLGEIGQPYFEEAGADAHHADGIHLNRVARTNTFYPLPVHGVIHRHTPISVWSKG